MIPILDPFLNKLTMYRLTLYYLIGLVLVAVVATSFGLLPYSPFDILLNTGIAVIGCYIFNFIFSKLFGAVTNIESVFITALILVLIIPIKFPVNATFFMLASAFAMASKYFLTVEKQHVFNPAAAAIAGIALLSPEHAATWWVGTPVMLPIVLIGGLLIVRKIRREDMVFTFLFIFFILISIAAFIHSGNISGVVTAWQQSVTHSALFFFTFVMFTEPLTAPGRRELQQYYAGIVAVLYATPQLRLFNFAITPELALCVGNVYSHFISPKYRFLLPLVEKIQATKDTLLFIFPKNKGFSYIPGQYMEWTLPHSPADGRGNRRYFSLASSPTEDKLMLTVKFYNPSSSYKNVMSRMENGQPIIASQLSGDFTLPKNHKKPLVFLAGGVGIAPFRSMVQYIVDKQIHVNIILLFANRTIDDILFQETFKKAELLGVKTHYILTSKDKAPENWPWKTGHIDEQILTELIPDYTSRTFYISGPQLMVQSFETLLSKMGISRQNIISDFFPGYEEK